ncbi:MAG: hypothetical protein GTN86_12590 [Xanthomonadales bacterium]|uniref:hypothetical protein n=1 Tax=Hydrogenophaga sp. TaxID=1904254 RepID=UPI0016A41177|nr:hypothetical protein [Hydrogenophaga sp.]NIQ36730.1 hypothetical protein [Xanthomonadales bacterium]NIM41998.1 hypothetical protein [Hydrogenophaga sp.]NIN27301.1 hypothetical protein [Hydrogenophaga sp.]NIN32002.1 hypothetical protein [Hydrogenophaga sp.]NIN56154.1 hypothetical protein [Hydrogenophaga sp.]
MEFYLDRFYNYQAGGQNWNVDFNRLPVSVQKEALAALQTLGKPDSLVTLAGLQTQFPAAFTKVSSVGTLPAPDLSQSISAIPLQASVDTLLAFIFNKTMDMAIEASESGSKNAVNMNVAQANLSDEKYKKQMLAALENLIGGVLSGTVSMAAGVGSLKTGGDAATDSLKHNKMLKDVSAAKRNTDDYKNTMERNVKGLEDRAQLNRETAGDLDKYANEINSPKGLSDDSRKKVDADIKDKEEQLLDCSKERERYDSAILDAETKLKDGKLSAAAKAKVQEELDGLKSRRDSFRADMDAQEVRLDSDIKALKSVQGMDDNAKQLKAKTDRLEELQQLGVRTPAEDKEMQQLQTDIPKHVQKLSDGRVDIQVRIDKLKSEATELSKNASALQKSVQDELASRQKVHAENEHDVMQVIDQTKNEVTSKSASWQILGGTNQIFGAGPQMLAQEDTAQGEHIEGLRQFLGTSADVDKDFARALQETADDTRSGLKDMEQQQNDLTKAIAGNMA